METLLNHVALEHRIAIAQRFADRMTLGDAVFLRDTMAIPDVPHTVTNGEKRPFGGVNVFMLMQVMKDRAWSDSRFFTADQIKKAGWVLKPEAKHISLQFLVTTASDGLKLENPKVKRFNVFNASEINGVKPADVTRVITKEDVVKAASEAGFPIDRGFDVTISHWLTGLGAVENSLGARMAASLLHVQLGVPLVGAAEQDLAQQWAREAREHPMGFFESARQAHLLASSVMRLIHIASVERQTEAVLKKAATAIEGDVVDVTTIRSNKGVAMVRTASPRVEALFQERIAVLSVPYQQKDRAAKLGAVWYPPQSLWFVPKGLSLEPFKEWDARMQSLGPVASVGTILDSFAIAMADLGLVIPAEIEADGQWHSAPVNSKNGKNKSGAYILSLAGARDGGPIGTINNKHTGQQFTWKYDGPLLTPEQRARLNAEIKEREARAEREIAAAREKAAKHAKQIWSLGTSAESHPYVLKKGISSDGLRQVPGAVLLGYEEFKSESGKSAIRANESYLIVPMSNEADELRAVQAISPDGSVKSFMRGAQKKGTMFLLGAQSLASLKELTVGAVAYAEGVATGKSVCAASGMPVIVCFDAGNLETVVPLTTSLLPSKTLRVLAVDNDQFFMERAMGFLSENVGLNPYAPGGETVAVINGSHVRSVALGEMKVDGQWHQTTNGSYCASLVHEDGNVLVRSIELEAVDKDGKKQRAAFVNRGVEAGKSAMDALISNSKTEPNCVVMVVPEFNDVTGRPTDFNDLHKQEGLDSVREQLVAGGVMISVRAASVEVVARDRVLAGIER